MSHHALRLDLPFDDPWFAERPLPPVSHRAADRVPVLLPNPSRTGRKVLIGVLVVLLGLGALGFLLAQPILREYPSGLHRPDSVAGMPMLTDPASAHAAEQIRAAIVAGTPVDDLTVGFYAADTDPARPVLVIAGTGLMLGLNHQLDAGFAALARTGVPVTGVTAVDPGFLGGVARCGTINATANALCVWVDHGSVGVVGGYGRDPGATAELMRRIRAEVLYRR